MIYKINNFDNWIEDEESGKFGSGASEKIWLFDPNTGKKGLFKYPKVKDKEKNIVTGEYWAEKLASEIAKLLDIKCSDVDIGYYNGRIGSMSYNFIGKDEILSEGITFIEKKYPSYNEDKLYDENTEKKYTVQMINESISYYFDSILQMIIFDSLIGNSDCHHSNWGIIYKFNYESGLSTYFSPLYDNGSSLCAYINPLEIELFLKDKVRYNALIDTKSKSSIGWNNKRPIRHFELLENIKNNYYKETINYIMRIKSKITKENVLEILNNFSNDIINNEMKQFLLKYILDRKRKILEIYNLEDNDE